MRIDRLEIADYRIYQDDGLFRFGTDAVLLYNFAPEKCGNTVDLCSGNGAVALLLLAGGKTQHITTLEILEKGCTLCRDSARLNGCEDKMNILHGNLCHIDALLPAESFDTVTVNPPYFKRGCGLLPDEKALAVARHEVECTIDDVLHAARYLLKENGTLCMVHRRHRMAEILNKLALFDLRADEVCSVHTLPDKEGPLFLLRAVKTQQALRCKQTTFTVMNDDHSLSAEYQAIYQQGE